MTDDDLQEMLDEIERRKKKRKIAEDGEIVVAPMAIMDSWHGVDAQVPFDDARQQMEDAYRRSVDDLNGWRDEPASTTGHARLSDSDAAEAAYQRSVDSLNAWRNQ